MQKIEVFANSETKIGSILGQVINKNWFTAIRLKMYSKKGKWISICIEILIRNRLDKRRRDQALKWYCEINETNSIKHQNLFMKA